MDPNTLLENFGFPVATCAAMLLAFWRCARWFAGSVAAPLITSHQQFLVKIEQHLHSQDITQSKQNDILQQLVESQNTILDEVTKK